MGYQQWNNQTIREDGDILHQIFVVNGTRFDEDGLIEECDVDFELSLQS